MVQLVELLSMKIKGQKKDNKKGWIAIGITLLLAILLNLYNKFFQFLGINKSKLTYSKRTKIIVIVLLVLLTLYIGIGEDPLYTLFTSIEGGLWITIMAWLISMYFDGKGK